jgi:hypothetical protein
MNRQVLFFLTLKICFCTSCFLSSCDTSTQKETIQSEADIPVSIHVPEFNSDSAYQYVVRQVSFGPRVPNTAAHRQCGDWLIEMLQRFSDTVYIQAGEARAFDNTPLQFRNIIGAFNPQHKKRIILAAHWDTRPFADRDKDPNKWREPIAGANDGGSGVAVLLETARQLHANKPDMGIDIIFFDAEDYGQPAFSKLPEKEDTYCLGSQYWAKNPHVPGYKAKYGILLDMVGARDSRFLMEGHSMKVHPELVRKIWNKAHQLGYTRYFLFQKAAPIIDDHYYVSKILEIPMINIVSLHPQNLYAFHESWHTHEDNLSVIDKNTLHAVGNTMLHVIYYEAAGKF